VAGLRENVESVLSRHFPNAGLDITSIPASGNYSIHIVWPGFDDLDIRSRQRKVWDVLRSDLTSEDQKHLGVVFTLTPTEEELTQEDEE
jgi:hypothetical protein